MICVQARPRRSGFRRWKNGDERGDPATDDEAGVGQRAHVVTTSVAAYQSESTKTAVGVVTRRRGMRGTLADVRRESSFDWGGIAPCARESAGAVSAETGEGRLHS